MFELILGIYLFDWYIEIKEPDVHIQIECNMHNSN